MSSTQKIKYVKIFNTTMEVVSKSEQMNRANTLYLYVETINKVTYLKFGEAHKSTVWDRYNSTGNTQHDKIIKVWKSSLHDKPIHKLLKDNFEWAGNKNENPLNTNEAYIVRSAKEVKSLIKFIDDIVCNDKIGPDFFRDRFGEPALTPRNYQADVINKAKSILSNKNRVLINLSTRAGKSFVSLKICKDLGANNILILTPFPSAEDSFAKLGYYNLEFAGYKYTHISANTSEKEFCDKNIIFCSYQFYDNSKKVIEYINKNIKFDFVILDECHNTSDSVRTDEVILSHVKYDKLIYMSGTPFNDLYSGYFNKDEVVTFDFIDFIKYAKANPNEISLPELNIKNVCNLSDLQNYLTHFDPDIFSKADCFDYDTIFSDDQHAESFFRWLTQDVKTQGLIIDRPRWFNLHNQKRIIAFFKTNKQVSVAARGLKSVLSNWNILPISGDDALLDSKEKDINEAFEKENTIILTCGKLTTGVTIPKLDTVWYFKDSSSTELFIQILFRTMTPCKGKDSVSMYCFDTESSLRIIKEYACIRLSEHSTSVTKDEDSDTFKGVIEDILSCINFTYLDINEFKWRSENADDYFEKVHNLPYTHRVTDAFKNWHSFDGVSDLGTEMLTEKDLIVTKSQHEAIRKQCERNNKLRDILKSVDNSNKDNKTADDYLSDKVVKQVLKILVNLDKHILVYSNIKSYKDLESIWPDNQLSQYKDNFVKLLSDNKVQLNQMIEDIRYKEAHDLNGLLNSLSFSNSTDMKTPDKLLEKMYSRLSNLTGTLCDPCCGIGTMFEYAVAHHGFSKDMCYGIEIDPLNVAICHKLGYKNVIQGDATDMRSWNVLIELVSRNTCMTKFDHIIMNPPYNRNLHLKILNEAIKHSDDIINLSPVRWLQDPLAEYKKNSDFKKFKDIRDHIEDLEVIPTNDANQLFNIMLLQPLGVYHITDKTNNIINHNEWYQKIFKKIVSDDRFKDMNVVNYSDCLDNYVCLNVMAPPMKYGKPMYDWLKRTGVCNKHNSYSTWKAHNKSATRGDTVNTKCVIFNTYNEALNCYNAMNTKLARFCCAKSVVDVNVHPQFAPWMEDYTHPWTDEMMYKYFELTPEEIQTIEDEFKDETK